MPTPPNRKVLVVSPHFPPTNAPDMQRARLALPYLRQFGWEPVVLAIAPEAIEDGVRDDLLESTYPPDIRVIRVTGLAPSVTRRFGFGSLWLRCGSAVRAAGEALLRSERFDLVFFSTTQFDAFCLGPGWRARFGVPYVLDYQDPWVNDYYSRTKTLPPGGRLKYAFSQWRARRLEPRVLRGASGVVSVSSAYGATLAHAYPWFDPGGLTVLPFGAAPRDLLTAATHAPADPLVPFGDGNFHLVYAGRCGPDMNLSLTILFRAFKVFLRDRPEEARSIRFHFIGTDYAPRPLGREWALPLARSEGVVAYVSEHCYRIPYFDALYYLTRADALVCVGSNDPTYSASKIFPYVLARRPMLVLFNQRSPVLAIAARLKAGRAYGFDQGSDIGDCAQLIAREWFIGGAMRRYEPHDEGAFTPFTAEGMTEGLAGVFARAAAAGTHPQ